MASVFFAAFFSILMISFQSGTFGQMIDNTLRTQAGHIQIHAKGYWEDKSADNFMFMDAATLLRLEEIPNIENVSPRLETFAMAASEANSKGIALIGISPEKEAVKSNLPSRIREGAYLAETDDGILLGEGVARYLSVAVGDTLALIGQGYHGSSAAALFPIRGIVKLITQEMDNSLAYLTRCAAQSFIDMPDGYSGILISITDGKRLNETTEAIKNQLSASHNQPSASPHQSSASHNQPSASPHQSSASQNQPSASPHQSSASLNHLSDYHDVDYEVLSWHFTMERLLETEKSDRMIGVVVIFILYVIVGFGILGTVVMLTNERRREFCMMISLGMTRLKLAITVVIELLIMSLMGVVFAFGVSFPIAIWFNAHPIEITGKMAEMFIDYGMEPILPLSIESSIFTNQITAVLVIVAITLTYPVRKIMKLKIASNRM